MLDVGPELLEALALLERELPRLAEEGFRLVGIRELLQ